MKDPEALERIGERMSGVEQAEEDLLDAVQLARKEGWSWDSIAPWLGKNSRQAAAKWWSFRRQGLGS